MHYAKFDVSSLFCSKVIEEKLLGGRLEPPPPPPPSKGRVPVKIIKANSCKTFEKRDLKSATYA